MHDYTLFGPGNPFRSLSPIESCTPFFRFLFSVYNSVHRFYDFDFWCTVTDVEICTPFFHFLFQVYNVVHPFCLPAFLVYAVDLVFCLRAGTHTGCTGSQRACTEISPVPMSAVRVSNVVTDASGFARLRARLSRSLMATSSRVSHMADVVIFSNE